MHGDTSKKGLVELIDFLKKFSGYFFIARFKRIQT